MKSPCHSVKNLTPSTLKINYWDFGVRFFQNDKDGLFLKKQFVNLYSFYNLLKISTLLLFSPYISTNISNINLNIP